MKWIFLLLFLAFSVQATTITGSLSSNGSASSSVHVGAKEKFGYSVSGTFSGKVRLERSSNAGAAWVPFTEFTSASSGVLVSDDIQGALFRFRVVSYTSGTIVVSLNNEPQDKEPALISARIKGHRYYPVGTATGQSMISSGTNKTEGMHFKVIDELVDLTAAGATYKAMTTPIPTGAVILSVQANSVEELSATGTSVKFAVGLNAGDVDKYGISSGLTQNLKINTVPDWAVLSAPEQLDVTAVVTNGSALGNGNFSAGKVRVRVNYLENVSLSDAP